MVPDLGSKCLQRFSADDKIRRQVRKELFLEIAGILFPAFALVTILISMDNYIAPLDKTGTGIPIFFICHQNICCGYSFVASHETLQMSSHNKCIRRQIRKILTKVSCI